MVHKKLLKQIGLDLAYLKKRAPEDYELIELSLASIARSTKVARVHEANRRLRMRLTK